MRLLDAKPLPWIAVLALAGAGLLLWPSGGGAPPPAADDASTAIDREPLAPGALEALWGAAEDAADDSAPGSGETRVALRDEDRLGPVLRVVDAASRAPVADAEVFAAEAERVPGGRGPWAERLLRIAAPHRTDADGRVVLAPIQQRVLVAARADGRFGVASFDNRARGELVVALEIDRTVTVRVVDHAGQPRAGVPVALCVDLEQRLAARDGATTDADGIVRFAHLQLSRGKLPPRDPELEVRVRDLALRTAELTELVRTAAEEARVRVPAAREQLQRAAQLRERVVQERRRLEQQQRARVQSLPPADQEALADADFVVLAEVPQCEPAWARFSVAAIPAAPIVLRIGPCGSLVVRLYGPENRPLESPCDVIVRASATAPAPGSVPAEQVANVRGITELRAEKPLGADSVRFPIVGAGLPLDVAVRFPDDDFDFGQQDIAPLRAGEVRELGIAAPSWFTAVTGRLVDESGMPAAIEAPEMFVAGAAGRIEGEELNLGTGGRFELPVRLRGRTPPYTLEVLARRGERRLGALVALPELEPGQRHEIGNVTIRGLATLAHGVVRDDRGEPIAGAVVALQTLRPAAGPAGAWRDDSFVRDRTDAAGRFRLFGEPRELAMRLMARARDHGSAETEAIAFGSEQALVLERLGGLVSDGLVPDWLLPGALRAQLLAGSRVMRDHVVGWREDGHFEYRERGLRPGTYDLVFTVRGVPQPLLRIAGLYVPPGGSATDARTRGLDLRGELFRYGVQAVDAAGRPVRPGSPLLVSLRDAAGNPQIVGFPWRGDRVEFVVPEPQVEIVALADAHRPTRRLAHPGDTRVVLHAVHPVEVQLPGLRALVGDTRVRVSLVFTGDTGLPMTDFQAVEQRNGGNRGYARAALGKSGGAWLGDNDTVRVPLMLDGVYEVVVRLHGAGAGPVSRKIGTVPVTLEGAAPMRAVVTPPADVVRDALAELAAARAAAQPGNDGRRR
jgi:hypothetical protein